LEDGRLLERTVVPRQAGGKAVGVVTHFRDITERAAPRKLTKPLGGGKHWPLFWVDLVKVYANKAACEQLDYGIEAFIGMGINTWTLTSRQAGPQHQTTFRDQPGTHGTLKVGFAAATGT
jgi:PAS domain-containing protein